MSELGTTASNNDESQIGKTEITSVPASEVEKPKRLRLREKFDNFVLSRFYGTEQFASRYAEKVEKLAEEKLKLYDDLPEKVFADANKQPLRDLVYYHFTVMAGVTIWWEAVAHFFITFIINVIGEYFYYGITAFIVGSTLTQKAHIPVWYWLYIVLLVILVMRIRSQKERLCNYAPGKLKIIASLNLDSLLLIFYGMVAYFITHISRSKHLGFFWVTSLSSAKQGFLYSILDISSSLGFLLSAFLYLRWRNSKYPDTVIVNDLVELLAGITTVEKHPMVWSNLALKRAYLWQLEEIVTCYEKYLPAQLVCRDPAIMAWRQRMFKLIANAVRDLMRWIIMPKNDTRDVLNMRLGALLSHSLLGDWDTLERLEPEDALENPALITRIFSSLRVLLQASLVPLGVYVFHSFQPHQHIPPFIYAIAIGWPVITLLSSLDTDVKSKLEILRSAVQIIPGSSEKNK